MLGSVNFMTADLGQLSLRCRLSFMVYKYSSSKSVFPLTENSSTSNEKMGIVKRVHVYVSSKGRRLDLALG